MSGRRSTASSGLSGGSDLLASRLGWSVDIGTQQTGDTGNTPGCTRIDMDTVTRNQQGGTLVFQVRPPLSEGEVPGA